MTIAQFVVCFCFSVLIYAIAYARGIKAGQELERGDRS